MKYQVISPDGIPIQPKPHGSFIAAHKALKKWVDKFRPQGYYRLANGNCIPVRHLHQACKIESIVKPWNRIIISVEGGVCHVGHSTVPIIVHLVDWDNIKAGEPATESISPIAAKVVSEASLSNALAEIQKEIDEYNRS